VIFEEDFIDVSYGFRPDRSCHDALDMIDKTITTQPVNYVVDMDMDMRRTKAHRKVGY